MKFFERFYLFFVLSFSFFAFVGVYNDIPSVTVVSFLFACLYFAFWQFEKEKFAKPRCSL